jgi:hypothetical protein
VSKQSRLFTGLCLLSLFTLSPSLKAVAQEGSAPATGCSALDKNLPLLFIVFEGEDYKAWAGDKYAKGVLLRVRNNSNCGIILETSTNTSDRAKDGEKLSLKYLMKYPTQPSMVMGGFGGDVLESVGLRGGDSVLFSVPLENFKKKGTLLLPFNYEWEESVIFNKGAGKYLRNPVEHYMRFGPELLPTEMLR